MAEFINPRAHVRVEVEKNSKGYNMVTSISYDWDCTSNEGDIAARANIVALLKDADAIAREEVQRRIKLDANAG